MKEEGNCYPNAYNLLMKLKDEGINAVLVHGKFTNKDGSIIDHAWVELDELLWDPSIDFENPIQILKKHYYEVGKVSDTHKYSFMETLEKFISLRNYGPWHF